MRLYRVAQLHRMTGLSLGIILCLLAVTGFFLDHDSYDWLWNSRFKTTYLPAAIVEKLPRAFSSFKVDAANKRHVMAGSRMGFFVSLDGARHFQKTLQQQLFTVEPLHADGSDDFEHLFAGASSGVYQSADGGFSWRLLALKNEAVHSLSSYRDELIAVVDKSRLYRINIETGKTTALNFAAPARQVLPDSISLGRLVRDIHYGRGLFSGDSSLFINDYAALLLIFLMTSGLVIYLLTRRIRRRKAHSKKPLLRWRKLHSNGVALWSFIPVFLLLVTGVVLDHPDFFRQAMRQIRLPIEIVPPVYRDLSSDIWGIDFDGKTYRIGNRLGVFKSSDLQHWQLENQGFAWRMKRLGDRLFVSGMGSPNRLLTDGRWRIVKDSPRMPVDVYDNGQRLDYFTRRSQAPCPLPEIDEVPLYLVLMGVHDGSFFHPLWVYVNDLAALAAIVLFGTGYIKWRRKRRINRTAG